MRCKVFLLVFLVVFISIVFSFTFIDNSQSDFDSGTYNNTYYNETNNAVQLNLSYASGTFTSRVFSTGSNISFNNLSWENQRIQCPEGMVYINKLGGYCIDKYEAVAMNADGTWNESSDDNDWDSGSTSNLLSNGGYASSEAGHYPWVYISQIQARTACENAGKHLCTSNEWLGAANIKGQIYNLDATISDCNVVGGSPAECTDSGPNNGDACVGGYMTECYSLEGVYDMTGNVWEWTNETIDKVTSPSGVSGWHYINTSDLTYSNISSSVDDGTYGKDGTYFNTGIQIDRAVGRGGNCNYGANAGPFCSYLNSGDANTYCTIGFRCCSVP